MKTGTSNNVWDESASVQKLVPSANQEGLNNCRNAGLRVRACLCVHEEPRAAKCDSWGIYEALCLPLTGIWNREPVWTVHFLNCSNPCYGVIAEFSLSHIKFSLQVCAGSLAPFHLEKLAGGQRRTRGEEEVEAVFYLNGCWMMVVTGPGLELIRSGDGAGIARTL